MFPTGGVTVPCRRLDDVEQLLEVGSVAGDCFLPPFVRLALHAVVRLVPPLLAFGVTRSPLLDVDTVTFSLAKIAIAGSLPPSVQS